MKKSLTFNNENPDINPKAYKEMVGKVEKIISRGCQSEANDDWLELWKYLKEIDLYPMIDIFDELIVHKDVNGMRFIVLSTRPFGSFPLETSHSSPRRLETYLREARIHNYEILINPHLEEYGGSSLLIDVSSGNLFPIVAKYNDERLSYDLF